VIQDAFSMFFLCPVSGCNERRWSGEGIRQHIRARHQRVSACGCIWILGPAEVHREQPCEVHRAPA
jgi:hypothetical protein